MDQLHAEVGVAQLSKSGEELCGDMVEVVRTPQSTIVVLSDGLGSGVKANILATLTTKIAASMLQRGIPLEEVVSTIAETLPVCKERKIAYSTLHIIKISNQGLATIVEFDCPASLLIRGDQVLPFPCQEKIVSGKTIREGRLLLQKDDVIVAVTDGVIHAGIGGLLRLGWGWEGIAAYLTAENLVGVSAEQICRLLIHCAEGYYIGKPGDDSSVAAIKIRQPRYLTLFTGPPTERDSDEKIVKRFLAQPGKKVVAGGTTANIVSRITGNPLAVDLDYPDPDIPPIGHIEGIDLVTEGVLTLNAAIDRLNRKDSLSHVKLQDGATLLARMLLESDTVTIFAGGAVNPAHQNPHFPSQLNIKLQVIGKLQATLTAMGKTVVLEQF
ncbi:MAG: serine/threonine-protein phosphatase [Negativicutes bacterium]|nr:serine/threonine-protein phosphatase [Negativicutes bacterium]